MPVPPLLIVRRLLRQPSGRTASRGTGWWVVPALLTAALVALFALAALRQRRSDGLEPLLVLTRHDAWQGALALVVLLATTLVVLWWPRRRQSRQFTVVAALTLGAVALVLGLASYLPCSGGVPLFAPLTWTLGLFFGSREDVWAAPPCTGPAPLALSVAHLSALLTTAVGFAAVLVAVTRDQWDRLRVRLAGSVVVVAGLDDVILPLVAALRAKSPEDVIVVVDPDSAHPMAGRARAAGARVVAGEVADPGVARALTMRGTRLKVRSVYLVSPDATVNLQRLATLVDALGGDGRPAPRKDGVASRVVLRVDDPWQVEDHRRTALDARYRPWVLEAVSIFETTARGVVDRLTEAGTERLLLVGSSPLTLALLAELARRERELGAAGQLDLPPGLVGPPLPGRVVVLAPDADELLRDHRDQQARFGNTGASAPEWVVGEEDAQQVERLVGQQAWAVVVASPPSTASALLAARIAMRQPACSVDLWSDVAARASGAGPLQRPHPFALTLTQPDGRLGDDSWERVARLLHEQHRHRFPVPAGAAAPPSRELWESLAPFYRESGLRQIRTVLEAVTAQHRSWGPVSGGAPDLDLSEPEVTAVAAAEHESWVGYYRANGWRPEEPGAKRSGSARRHPMLRSWSSLEPHEQQRTHDLVRRTVQLLRTLGYRPVRDQQRT